MSSDSGGFRSGSASSAVQPRYEWYQTESDVTVIVRVTDADVETTQVVFEPRSVRVRATKVGGAGVDFQLALKLASVIVPGQSSFRVMKSRSKVELRMRKAVGGRWTCVEDGPSTATVTERSVSSDDGDRQQVKSYPTSSVHGPKDWDKLEKQVTDEEEKEQLEGDAAVNKLFRKIYAESSDDVKRAMMKSFIESGGTVLSTNWDDVKSGPVEMKPPEGLEWKKW